MHLTSEMTWHNSSRKLPARREKFLNSPMPPPTQGKLELQINSLLTRNRVSPRLSLSHKHKLSQRWVHRGPQWYILMTRAKWPFLALGGPVTCTISTNNSVHTQIWVSISSFSLPKGLCAFLPNSSCLDVLFYTKTPLQKHSSHWHRNHWQDQTQKPALPPLLKVLID